MYNRIQDSFTDLQAYCDARGYKGYDPYDGLSSSFFRALPFISKNRTARLIWIQGFKKLPVNLRPFFGIKEEYNPKALALFLSSYVLLFRKNQLEDYKEKIVFFSEKLLDLSSKGYSGKCWGYNFDWESRAFFLPKYTPTIVVSSYVANALLDAYEILSDEKLLKAARSTCDFILKDLNRKYDDKGNFIFSYSKFDNSAVYNASLLGSRLLSRVYSLTRESILLEEAKKSVVYVSAAQKTDGSWTYGELPFHQWIDNFHTGFNLECISDFAKYSGDRSFDNNITIGFNYYTKTFFTAEGIAKYYNNTTYPVDIHAPAQLIITVCKLGRLSECKKLADTVLNWTVNHMQSEKGYFYFQVRKHSVIKIPYMRWSQAWIFYAMSTYLFYAENDEPGK